MHYNACETFCLFLRVCLFAQLSAFSFKPTLWEAAQSIPIGWVNPEQCNVWYGFPITFIHPFSTQAWYDFTHLGLGAQLPDGIRSTESIPTLSTFFLCFPFFDFDFLSFFPFCPSFFLFHWQKRAIKHFLPTAGKNNFAHRPWRPQSLRDLVGNVVHGDAWAPLGVTFSFCGTCPPFSFNCPEPIPPPPPTPPRPAGSEDRTLTYPVKAMQGKEG